MTEQAIPKDKHFVTIKRYQEISGMSYATINHLLDSGQLPYITTTSGKRRVDTGASADSKDNERLEHVEKMLTALCRQFNTSV
jgi:predicted site-specific integrase-resolvase